jgi:hypothetical protein
MFCSISTFLFLIPYFRFSFNQVLLFYTPPFAVHEMSDFLPAFVNAPFPRYYFLIPRLKPGANFICSNFLIPYFLFLILNFLSIKSCFFYTPPFAVHEMSDFLTAFVNAPFPRFYFLIPILKPGANFICSNFLIPYFLFLISYSLF